MGWAQGKKKNPEVKMLGDHGGQGGASPLMLKNRIFLTLKMQFQGLLIYKLQGLSTNATPKLLQKL